jgi:16S rRNA (cytosine967-C5)-methyltransferase
MGLSPARRTAFRILERVERHASYATDLLHSSLTAALSHRDAALTEELVLGVLRRQGQLDHWIAQLTPGRPGKLDREVRIALRLALYQLGCLDRVPPHAAVSESVELVKRARKASAAAFVNAVLRQAATPPPSRPDLAVPAWLLDRWRRHFGDKADALALATLETPATFVRLDPHAGLGDLEGVETEPADLAGAFRVVSGLPRRSERLRIQDLGSQRIVPLLDLGPQHRFLDVCAAPGNKTLQALEHHPRLAVACDLHYHRLRDATLPNRVVLDATRPLPFTVLFDRILVDAPCSGTGTLARHPEIKWKLTPADLDNLATRQRAILGEAFRLLAPGGRLVYSTCSLEPEENEEVVAGFPCLSQHLWLPVDQPGDGFFAAVLQRPADSTEAATVTNGP